MNHKIKTIILLAISLWGMQINLNAQTPQLVWANRIGTNYAMYSKSMTVDAAGNSYTTGHFYQTVDFDPGAGEANLTAQSNNGDIFIVKYNSNGNYVWVKQIGGAVGTYGLRANAITLSSNGSLYITGVYSGTVDFDPGAGTLNATSSGEDIFILKLDTNGNLVWAKTLGNSSTDRGLDIAVDASENIYTTGFFFGTVDFDPGDGTSNLSSASLSDIFVLKLDGDGNFVWAKRMGGSVYDYGQSIAVDTTGNVFTIGYFNGTADFDPGTSAYNLTTNGNYDIFISKLDVNGNFVWAKQFGGISTDIANSITLDPSGNIIASGYFNDIVDFDPSAGVSNLTSKGSIDIFILKLDVDGNFVWVKQLGGGAEDFAYETNVDASGNIYTTGYFWGTADFDPGINEVNLTPVARRDIFISVLNEAGNYVWAHSFGGIYEDDGYSIATDASGNLYTTGGFYQTVDFDPGLGVYNLSSGNYYNMFIVKLNAKTLGIDKFDQVYKLSIFPNPTSNEVEIDFMNTVDKGSIKVLDIQGRELFKTTLTKTAKVKIELNQPPGIYYFVIKTAEGQKIMKVIKE